MALADHLVIRVDTLRYAIPIGAVREAVRLPMLTPLPEAPLHVVGILNLRGTPVPVVDIRSRLGLPVREHALDEHIVLLEHEGRLTGILADVLVDVRPLAAVDALLPKRTGPRIAKGFVRDGDDVVEVIDAASMLFEVPHAGLADETGGFAALARRSRWPADAATLAIFRERAHALAAPIDAVDANQSPHALVRIGDERFAFTLEQVRGFIGVSQVTRLPGNVPGLLGLVNLRGQLVPLLSPHALLDIAAPADTPAAAVVLELGDEIICIAVDEGIDLRDIKMADIRGLESSRWASREHLRGTAEVDEGIVSVLDLPRVARELTEQINA